VFGKGLNRKKLSIRRSWAKVFKGEEKKFEKGDCEPVFPVPTGRSRNSVKGKKKSVMGDKKKTLCLIEGPRKPRETRGIPTNSGGRTPCLINSS